MSQWGHGHSLGVGALAGLLAAGHPLWIASVCALAGFAAGRAWAGFVRMAGAVRGRLER